MRETLKLSDVFSGLRASYLHSNAPKLHRYDDVNFAFKARQRPEPGI